MATIIPFTKAKQYKNTVENQPTDEEMKMLALYQEIEDLTESYSRAFIETFDEAEIGEDDELFAKDFAYFMESFRAILFRDYGLEHPFHSHVEKYFEVAMNEEGEWEIRWAMPEEDNTIEEGE
jgi:hypothetical protein